MKHSISDDKKSIVIDYRHFHMSERKLYIRNSKLMKGDNRLPVGRIGIIGKKHIVTFEFNLNRTYRDNNSVKYWFYQYSDSDLMAPGECALYELHVQDDSARKNQPFPDGFDPEET